MPQVTVPQPTNLMEMFQSPSPMLWDIANNNVDQYRRANEANIASALQEQDFTKQKQPFELSRLGLENQSLEAQIPGQRANSSILQDKAIISRDTLDQQRKATLSDLAAKVSSNDLEEAENHIKEMMAHPDPKIRAQGKVMYGDLAEIQKEKLKQAAETARALTTAREQGNIQTRLHQMDIDAGKFSNKSWNQSIDLKIRNAKNPEEKLMHIDQAYNEATSPEAKQHYADLHEEIKPLYDNYMATKPSNAGKPSIEALGITPVTTPTAPSLVPRTSVGAESRLDPGVIQKAFGSYDPTKYEYRINPQTGKVQRKPKG